MEDAHPDSTAAPSSQYQLIAEVDPPKGTALQPFLDDIQQLRGRLDTIRVTDSEHAIMRMSPLAPCVKLKELGMHPVMVINGRDRNRISFQADLLAATALGIDSIVIKQGHDPAEGDQPMARSSGDLDMVTMVKCAQALNNGKDLAGETLAGGTKLTYGISLELSDDTSRNRQLAASFAQLADSGVSSVTLGPTYDLNILELFPPAAEKQGIKLFTSIMFLKSVAMVRYLNNLPGVPSVPQEFLKKMMEAPVKKDAGLQIAYDLYRDLAPLGSGTVLLALGWQDRLPDFLDLLGR